MVLNIINIIEEKIKPGIQWNSLQQEATRLVCEHLLQVFFFYFCKNLILYTQGRISSRKYR